MRICGTWLATGAESSAPTAPGVQRYADRSPAVCDDSVRFANCQPLGGHTYFSCHADTSRRCVSVLAARHKYVSQQQAGPLRQQARVASLGMGYAMPLCKYDFQPEPYTIHHHRIPAGRYGLPVLNKGPHLVGRVRCNEGRAPPFPARPKRDCYNGAVTANAWWLKPYLRPSHVFPRLVVLVLPADRLVCLPSKVVVAQHEGKVGQLARLRLDAVTRVPVRARQLISIPLSLCNAHSALHIPIRTIARGLETGLVIIRAGTCCPKPFLGGREK